MTRLVFAQTCVQLAHLVLGTWVDVSERCLNDGSCLKASLHIDHIMMQSGVRKPVRLEQDIQDADVFHKLGLSNLGGPQAKGKLPMLLELQDSVERMVTDTINASSNASRLRNASFNPNATEKDSVRFVLSYMTNVIRAAASGHQEDQGELNDAFTEVKSCNSDAETAMVSVTTWKNTVDTRKRVHSECREIEASFKRQMDTGCAQLSTLRATGFDEHWDELKRLFTTAKTEAQLSFMYEAIAGVHTWITIVNSAKTACVDNTTSQAATKKHCGGNQTLYERDRCDYHDKQNQVCKTLDGCYDRWASYYNTRKQFVEKEAQMRKAEYIVAKKVECLLEIFVDSFDNQNRVSMDRVNRCKSMSPSTDHLDISYATVPTKYSCTELGTAEGEQTCDAAWVQAEYKDKAWYGDANTEECVPCPTPPPTPAPTEAATTTTTTTMQALSVKLADSSKGSGSVSGDQWTQSSGWTGVRGEAGICGNGDVNAYTWKVQITRGRHHQVGVAPSACCQGMSTFDTKAGADFAALYSHSNGWDRHRGAGRLVGSPSRSSWWSDTWGNPRTLNVKADCQQKTVTFGIEGGDAFLGEMTWPTSWSEVYPFIGGQSNDHIVTLKDFTQAPWVMATEQSNTCPEGYGTASQDWCKEHATKICARGLTENGWPGGWAHNPEGCFYYFIEHYTDTYSGCGVIYHNPASSRTDHLLPGRKKICAAMEA